MKRVKLTEDISISEETLELIKEYADGLGVDYTDLLPIFEWGYDERQTQELLKYTILRLH